MTCSAFVLVMLMASLMVLVHGECDAPSQDNPGMKAAVECAKEFGKDKLCLADCIGMRLNLLSEEGKYQKEEVVKVIDSFSPGDLKEAFREFWKKCCKDGDGHPIDRKLPNCMGWKTLGRCFKKVMTDKCPALVKLLEL